MFSQKTLEELNAKMSEVLANSPAKDLEKNLRALMAGVFTRLDLVTREEFDVQSEMLSRARDKLDALEARLAELEKEPKGKRGGG